MEDLKRFRNVNLAAWAGPYRCPCCGFSTLTERGGDEICEVCFWEDDGQDDHDADEVRGGPNDELTLTIARQNFQRFGASREDVLQHVRKPTADEVRGPGSRLVDENDRAAPNQVLLAAAVRLRNEPTRRLGRIVSHWISANVPRDANGFPESVLVAWSLDDWRVHLVSELEPAPEPRDWLSLWTNAKLG